VCRGILNYILVRIHVENAEKHKANWLKQGPKILLLTNKEMYLKTYNRMKISQAKFNDSVISLQMPNKSLQIHPNLGRI
jgi:hypothetical protein